MSKPFDFSISPSIPSMTLTKAIFTLYSSPVSSEFAYLPMCMSAGFTTSK